MKDIILLIIKYYLMVGIVDALIMWIRFYNRMDFMLTLIAIITWPLTLYMTLRHPTKTWQA